LVQLTPENVIQKYYLIHAEATKEWRALCGESDQQYYSSKDISERLNLGKNVQKTLSLSFA
jgi:hypothetical protein